MQATATVCFAATFPLKNPKTFTAAAPKSSKPHRTSTRYRVVAAAAAAAEPDTSTIDYSSSPVSVFPVEACDVVGGEACDSKMFPETKLAAGSAGGARSRSASEEVDRDYLEYSDPKTVFPGDACDELGGEFCEAEYQKGVYSDQK